MEGSNRNSAVTRPAIELNQRRHKGGTIIYSRNAIVATVGTKMVKCEGLMTTIVPLATAKQGIFEIQVAATENSSSGRKIVQSE